MEAVAASRSRRRGASVDSISISSSSSDRGRRSVTPPSYRRSHGEDYDDMYHYQQQPQQPCYGGSNSSGLDFYHQQPPLSQQQQQQYGHYDGRAQYSDYSNGTQATRYGDAAYPRSRPQQQQQPAASAPRRPLIKTAIRQASSTHQLLEQQEVDVVAAYREKNRLPIVSVLSGATVTNRIVYPPCTEFRLSEPDGAQVDFRSGQVTVDGRTVGRYNSTSAIEFVNGSFVELNNNKVVYRLGQTSGRSSRRADMAAPSSSKERRTEKNAADDGAASQQKR